MKEFLKSMVKPRWQRGTATDRVRAVKELGEDESDILIEVVLTDDDETVRLTACKKLKTIECLESVIGQSDCEAVKAQAAKMIRKRRREDVLNAGDDWQDALAHVERDTCLVDIILATDNIKLRLAALERVSDHNALMNVVTGESGKEAGLKALERLESQADLEVVAKKGGNKAVRHEAQRRLDALSGPKVDEAQEEPEVDVDAELKDIIDYCETIRETYNFDAVATLLDQKKARWKQLDSNGEHPLQMKFQVACETFEKRKQEFAQKQAEQIQKQAEQVALKSQKEAVIGALDELSATDETFEETLGSKKAEWQALDRLDDEDEEEHLKRTFNRKLDEREAEHRTRVKEAGQKEKLEALCAELEQVAESGDDKALKNYAKRTWKAPTWQYNDAEPLKQRFTKAVAVINDKLETKTREREESKQQRQDELKQIVERVQKAVETENRKDAEKTVKGLQERWTELDGWSQDDLTKDYKEALDAFWEKQREFREEQNWQEWANKGIKEKLILAVEATAEMEDLKKVAKVIREAQKKWKEVGPVPYKDNQPMWDRFHQACETNYERCKEFFEEKDKQRQENLEICTKLCEEAEALKESDDWRSAVSRFKTMQREWKQHGALPRKQADELYARFRTACDAFFERFGEHMDDVDTHREENQAAKEALIKKAEALVSDDPAKLKPDACIVLQKEWKTIGPGLKEKDKETWDAFRSACDAFFETLDKEHEKNIPAKEELCEKAEKLIEELSDDSDRKAVADQMMDLQKAWKKLGPMPKSYKGDLSKRFQTACSVLFNQHRGDHDDIEDARERNLAIKRDLVTHAERLAESDDWRETAEELKQLQAEWKTVGPVPKEHDREVWKAFRKACDTFFSRRKEHFSKMDHRRQENLFEKEELLSALEDIVGADPKEAEEKPTESSSKLDLADQLQVAFATNFAMAGESSSDREEVRRIQARWKEVGPVPRHKNDELWKRYKTLLDKFYDNK